MVQQLDEENVINALNKRGFSVTRLTRAERFLQHARTSLLIGAPDGSEKTIIKTLEENCPNDHPISPHLSFLGLTERSKSDIFTFDVEQFIQF
jgi:uncharacterized protein YaaQ